MHCQVQINIIFSFLEFPFSINFRSVNKQIKFNCNRIKCFQFSALFCRSKFLIMFNMACSTFLLRSVSGRWTKDIYIRVQVFFLYIFSSQVHNITERIIKISTTGLR